MRFRHFILLILCTVVLASCTQTQKVLKSYSVVSTDKDWTIDMEVAGSVSDPELVVTTAAMSGCRNTTQKGCMIFETKKKGKIKFDINSADSVWHITQLKICKGKTPPDPLSLDCPLGANAFDFYVGNGGKAIIPDLLTGEINWSYSDAVRKFKLTDRNILEENYYYMVIACDGPDPDSDINPDNCITADPAFDNEGIQ